ncbi:MAG: hypothetical protein H6838_10535 [Planctomycetes bacterium]|nr:hypothetical protein [Planctomycetota bacterium]
MSNPPIILAIASLWLATGGLRAQSSVRDPFGSFDSRWNDETDAVQIAAAHGMTAVLKSSGSVQIWGRTNPTPRNCAQVAVGLSGIAMLLADGSVSTTPNLQPPRPPRGVTFTQIAVGYDFLLAVRSDGLAVGCGRNDFGQCNVPAPPPGRSYVEVSASSAFQPAYGMGRLSDGSVVTWGLPPNQGVVPSLPTGLTYSSISAGYFHAAAVRSDGQLVLWGNNYWGQCNAPALPPGMHYLQVSAAARHTLALRSDGAVLAFGDNSYGQCNVPSLPQGVTYVEVAAGGTPPIPWNEWQHSAARRSDGKVVAWGDNSRSQCNAPSPPAGLDYVDVACGYSHWLALLGDGTVTAWGDNSYGACDVPALPPGVGYVEIEPYAARRSDGAIVTWGNDPLFLTVPQLPNNVTYVELAMGNRHVLARRSDGQVIAWGDNSHGECLVPSLPPNVTFVEVAASGAVSMARRSDGDVVVWGDNSYGQCSVPWQVAQIGCVQIAARFDLCTALLADGSVFLWGRTSGSHGVPPLPYGVTYVGVSEGMARRSDGGIEQLAYVNYYPLQQPPSGTSYMQVKDAVARVGPTSTYVTFAPGCPGSLPASRLIPRDTPRVGAELLVSVRDLPLHMAVLCTGSSTTWSPVFGALPHDLAWLGMLGCHVFVDPEILSVVVGVNHVATFQLSIPNTSTLVGARYHQQALVPDLAAGNSLNAVLSDAATGVIGR